MQFLFSQSEKLLIIIKIGKLAADVMFACVHLHFRAKTPGTADELLKTQWQEVLQILPSAGNNLQAQSFLDKWQYV